MLSKVPSKKVLPAAGMPAPNCISLPEAPAANPVLNCQTAAFVLAAFVSAEPKTYTVAAEESTIGPSTKPLRNAMRFDVITAPAELIEKRSPPESATKTFDVAESKTGLLKMFLLPEVKTGQGAPASAGVPLNTPVNLWTLPELSPTYNSSVP